MAGNNWKIIYIFYPKDELLVDVRHPILGPIVLVVVVILAVGGVVGIIRSPTKCESRGFLDIFLNVNCSMPAFAAVVGVVVSAVVIAPGACLTFST